LQGFTAGKTREFLDGGGISKFPQEKNSREIPAFFPL
jgi:hypothetical protein